MPHIGLGRGEFFRIASTPHHAGKISVPFGSDFLVVCQGRFFISKNPIFYAKTCKKPGFFDRKWHIF